MSRIKESFQNGSVFIGYLTAGQRGVDDTVEAALALIEGGVNLLEIGMPFSDPIADGPVIQEAMSNALARGTGAKEVLETLYKIRACSEVPLILFTYANPILAGGVNFLLQAKKAGCDGILVVDLPPDTSGKLPAMIQESRLEQVVVLAPSTSCARIESLIQHAQGFIYYACRKGITGTRHDLPTDLAANLALIKQKCPLPVVVGFGIADKQNAGEALKYADGFVVGSAFVKAMLDGSSKDKLRTLAKSIDPREEFL